ncbi:MULTISPECIES: DUF11 domain-containing protein [unclassified Lysobacter]|uniref:prealbumin-like fold domain-containing protein n=1 Tax=unclassified Lysobacter TaxID=2635362 RepID=UPI001BEC4C45|nr:MULTISPECIES: DUF11 domain-containing protein [unclassified Lysobacter]MBT2745267.1 DUF11 domain-containing protein [Lysobacter sp. ISL-42]MBT2751864.1 DUF11 domain-containing protein [Lysobacter sp. ISL-50]MBT2777829.1 DUF11 domain-containing protein [Lysobacter sp. ISL-54]MBT2783085.1 DUF11 domain-containing protein [Lysobacter sp. ISL-52]
MKAPAQEIAGGECAAGASVATPNFDAGWFHNQPRPSPLPSRRQDGFWANPPGGPVVYWDSPRDASPIGVDPGVVANYAADEVVGSGLTATVAPATTRYDYLGVNGAGSTFAQAATGNDYLQYQFTTPANAAARLFFKRTGFGAYPSEAYSYAVRVSTDPTFASYWTITQNVAVTSAAGYTYNTANTSRFPLLRPNTTYYLRVYLYNRTGTTSLAPANTIGADDFQFGTAICPLPTVTVTKVSNAGTGTFNFTGSNGFAAQSIATVTPGIGVAGATQVMAAANTATTIAEAAPPAGFALTAINCTGLPSGTPTYTVNGVGGGNVVLPAAAMTPTANIACTFTNGMLANLSITKTNTPAAGALDQANDTVNSGQTTTYTLVVTNDGTTAVTGAIVRDTPGAGITCPSGNAVNITGAGVPAGSFTVADLIGANGIVLGALAGGQTTTLSFTCQVN